VELSSWTLLRNVFSSAATPETESEATALDRAAEAQAQVNADVAVMRRIQAGEKQALGLLYDRYSRLILGIGLRILRDSSEAQELVQDVFLYVFQKSQDFDPTKGPLSSWLVGITYSRAFNKREYLTLRRFYDYRHIDEVLDSVASDCSPERHGQTCELRELLRDALGALTETQRKTLDLFFWEGYSLREISIRLEETLGNTRNHYYRGLEKLRETVKLSKKHSGIGGR
jgi:RNA polymerase sigma-70 factor (ECF subfamily)